MIEFIGSILKLAIFFILLMVALFVADRFLGTSFFPAVKDGIHATIDFVKGIF